MDLTCGSGRLDDGSVSDSPATMHTALASNGSDGHQDVKPLTPAQELRKATKPLMEKRRRARINQCLQELKDLILEALNKDPARHNKLEKADILEMAVTHLKNVHRQALQSPPPPAESVGKYRAGFTECANEVSRFVNKVHVLQPDVKQKLIGHLSSCISTLDASPISPALAYPTAHSPSSQLECAGGHGASTPPLSYSPFSPRSPSSQSSSPLVPAQLVAFPGMSPPLNRDVNNNNSSSSSNNNNNNIGNHMNSISSNMNNISNNMNNMNNNSNNMNHSINSNMSNNINNNNNNNNINININNGIAGAALPDAEEDDAPLDFSKKYSPTHPGTTGGFPNPRKMYLASLSRGSSSSSSAEELPHASSSANARLSPVEPVNYSKNAFRGASAPRLLNFAADNRFYAGYGDEQHQHQNYRDHDHDHDDGDMGDMGHMGDDDDDDDDDDDMWRPCRSTSRGVYAPRRAVLHPDEIPR